MRRAVIVDAVRTPIGRAHATHGMFRDVRADDLSAFLIRSLIERSGVEPALIEDVKWGCALQRGEQGCDIARMAVLIADLPIETGGVTINRNCASSLDAINLAAMSIAAGCEDVQIAGGVEHMHHVPMTEGYEPGPSVFRKHSEAILYMGLTAEYLAAKYGIGRAEQDAFALRSHQLAAAATRAGHFRDEVIPTWGRDAEGHKAQLIEDQCIRPDCSPESLADLPPVFQPRGGTVTAGNSSPTNVGAAAVLVMSEDRARELELTPMARIRAMAVAGVDPSEMGVGPVPAVHKALQRADLELDAIDCIELNEAFAVQALAVLQLLGMDAEKTNTRGGAIALGHPLGASGARIVTTLLHRMRAEGGELGLATMCVGQGQGVATILEACEP